MKPILLFLAISILAFASCKKDKENEDCTLTETNLVGSYKVTSVKYKASASSTEIDYIDVFFDPCEKDDILTLNANHTYNYSDAGVTCSPNGNYDGDWSLNGNVLSVDGDPGTLENFDCSGFNAIGTDIYTQGDRVSLTYTKQ